jgi:ferrous iron transport protein A
VGDSSSLIHTMPETPVDIAVPASAAATSVAKPLCEARLGDEGRLKIAGELNPTLQRLMSMGMVPGAHLKVIRVAPLGDPIMIDVNGYQVSLRRREACGLSIEGLPAGVRGAGVVL